MQQRWHKLSSHRRGPPHSFADIATSVQAHPAWFLLLLLKTQSPEATWKGKGLFHHTHPDDSLPPEGSQGRKSR